MEGKGRKQFLSALKSFLSEDRQALPLIEGRLPHLSDTKWSRGPVSPL
jgi:hypothetical protein